MYRILTFLTFFIGSYAVNAQLNMTLKSNVKFDQNLSDIWGYADEEGREYAIVGLRSATAIVEVSDPENPRVISEVAGPTSLWRDIKTFKNHAFVITDRFRGQSGMGLHVLDLSNLPNALEETDDYFWSPVFPEMDSTQLLDCHNLYIEEKTGIAYLAGCNINNGGVIAVDVNNPDSIFTIAMLDPRYAHDVFVRNDTVYASDIFDASFSIVDARDKSNTTLLATQSTPSFFTHNAWLSDNGKVLFTTDERGNAPVAAYDISDLDDIKFLDEFRPTATVGRGLIPHNVHVLNDFLVTSFYAEGVIVTDASKPDNLIEVGNYDTYPVPGSFAGFNGCWGAYPFLPSGLVLASDIGNGLFVLEPAYVRAAYLEGLVTDQEFGNPIPGVEIKILSDDPNLGTSEASGEYKTGQVTAGTFTVEYSRVGYNTEQVEVQLVNGEVTIQNVELSRERLNFIVEPISCIEDDIRIQFSPNILEFSDFRWVFVDGVPDTSSIVEPVITYPTMGTYTVRLEALNNEGVVIDSIERVFDTPASVNADFEVTVNGREATFTNLSTNNANRFEWDFGETGFFSSDERSPIYQYETADTYLITLIAYNGCSEDMAFKEITITTTSLEEVGGLELFTLAPNPFQSATAISYRFNTLQTPGRLIVYDVLGNVLLEKPIQQKENQWWIGDNLPKGVYFVQLEINNLLSKTIKLVKQ